VEILNILTSGNVGRKGTTKISPLNFFIFIATFQSVSWDTCFLESKSLTKPSSQGVRDYQAHLFTSAGKENQSKSPPFFQAKLGEIGIG
jgi:hypothetical protein